MRTNPLDQSDIDFFFPPSYKANQFASLCGEAFGVLAALMPEADTPRIPGWRGAGGYPDLLKQYATIPADPHESPEALVRRMAEDLLAGAVNWRCPDLQYNLGAGVNVVAAALYALALDVNVYLINDGLAGSTVVAETAVGQILSKLVGLPPERAHGVFVFGGTGTMAYAIKAGIRKAAPDSARYGLPSSVKVMVTEDAHFSHATAADWLGIGSEDLLVIPATADRRSPIDAAEHLLRGALDAGNLVPTIILNGGTTYDHAVDDIDRFVELRDALVQEYQLSYAPHVHVDSVVGWAWLTFSGYDFQANPLGIDRDAAAMIERQHRRISQIRRADSWGVDFHKGVGACPIDCSIAMFNERSDLVRLSKGGGPTGAMHQLAEEFSSESPVDYTLETSRAGGKALAALASLHSLGQSGYQALLANLIENTVVLRSEIARQQGMTVLNPYALGYQTMIRLHPPGISADASRQEMRRSDSEVGALVNHGNEYLKAFFAWDNRTRMDANAGGVVYSFSRKYVRTPSGVDISGLKFYPTSPRITRHHVLDAVALLAERKAEFDAVHAEAWSYGVPAAAVAGDR